MSKSKTKTAKPATRSLPEPRMTDEEVKEVAMGLISGTIYTNMHLHEHEKDLLPCIFMTLMFIDEKSHKEMKDNDITMIWEHIAKATPRAINGHPIFASHNEVNRTDHMRIDAMVEKLRAAVEATK